MNNENHFLILQKEVVIFEYEILLFLLLNKFHSFSIHPNNIHAII
jgi:hypothetical protein